MLSPQEIAAKEFVKAVFGGYDMSSVDDFLESVNTDYAALYKENAILKSKIKVLVEKVEEYRSTEDAMRMALLTAQKMGEDMMAEANKKSAEVLSDAEQAAEEKLREMQALVSDEEARLLAARKETAKFVEVSNEIISRHMKFLSRLESIKHVPEAEPEPAEPTREEKIVSAAREINDAVGKIVAGDKAHDDDGVPTKRFEKKTEEEPTKLFDIAPKEAEYDDEDEFTSPRPKFDFDNLKFGVNFKDEDDG